LLVFIKAWTEAEGKKDLDILDAAANPQPRGPCPTGTSAPASPKPAGGGHIAKK
jgi:hypothetical protein